MILLASLFLLQLVNALPYAEKPVPQEVENRVFLMEESLPKTIIFQLDSLNNAGIIKAFGNSVFVLDYNPPALKKIDLESQKIVQKFGNGRGRGPGELLNPTDFALSKNGAVWIADEPQSKISVFTQKGDLSDDWIIEFTPYKLAGVTNNVAILGSLDPAIKFIDSSKTIYWTSHPQVENPRRWSNLITGFLLADSTSVYKISNFAGTFSAYDKQGNNRFFRKLIDSDQKLKSNPISGLDYLAYQLDRSELSFAVASGFINKEEIHLLIQFYGNEPKQLIDVYRTSDAEYLYSYKLDESVRSLTALENGDIIGLKSNEIIIWERN
ncbi:MAG: hypothetical protein WD016_07760 [Balneolaceae bacterium]